MSDSATTASTAVSLATITRIGCRRCAGRHGAAMQHAQLLAFLEAAVAAAGAEHGGDRLDVVRRRAEIAQVSTDAVALLATTTRSLKALPPVASLVVFGSSVMFSGTMRASKPA